MTIGLALGAALFLEATMPARPGSSPACRRALTLEVLGLAAAVVGVYLVAASPIVTSHLSHFRHRHPHSRDTDREGAQADESELQGSPQPR